MRDLSHDRTLLSINSMTVKAWSLGQLIEGCARAGISAISPWRDIVQACGPERAGKLIRAHGMTVTGLCRGGMFPATDEAGRRAALDDNRRAVDEAAAIGAQCLVLVVGGQESARSTLHLAELFRLADVAGLLADPDRAAGRMRHVMATRGVQA